ERRSTRASRRSHVDEDREGQRGFTVKDRRRFSESGDVREAETPPSAEPPPEPGPTPPPEPAAQPAAGDPAEPVTFSTFILGLSTQALLHLGEIRIPAPARSGPTFDWAGRW